MPAFCAIRSRTSACAAAHPAQAAAGRCGDAAAGAAADVAAAAGVEVQAAAAAAAAAAATAKEADGAVVVADLSRATTALRPAMSDAGLAVKPAGETDGGASGGRATAMDGVRSIPFASLAEEFETPNRFGGV
jgi:hypothetical protein